jgi:hypothetical protein
MRAQGLCVLFIVYVEWWPGIYALCFHTEVLSAVRTPESQCPDGSHTDTSLSPPRAPRGRKSIPRTRETTATHTLLLTVTTTSLDTCVLRPVGRRGQGVLLSVADRPSNDCTDEASHPRAVVPTASVHRQHAQL